MCRICCRPSHLAKLEVSILGRRTLWWNQRIRLQKLQGSRRLGFSGVMKGGPKQAVCPFCCKVFYDKSTMNRHVSKRVCLGLQFSNQDVQENLLPIASPPSEDEFDSETNSPVKEETEAVEPTKSGKLPCPYCNKLLKGERGVRKHIDFYGCPMAAKADK